MKRLITILIGLTFLVGCTPSFSGYVMDKREGAILVVDPSPQDFSHTKEDDRYYEAYWAEGDAAENVEIGSKVDVWLGKYVQESYPGQVALKRAKAVPTSKPEGAQLTEYEALRKALNKKEDETYELWAVSSIEYEKDEDQWKIRLISTFNGKEKEKQIELKDGES
ncbi:DUF3221 domain-containing protein [Halobacillus litoralis]|uniref:DUF3221 domain-containing protein n=1 Tax=Halobacillus litoralis TaxID=45668 RepID=UPI001CFE1780|nr:DUF3221 domain-containing protein [Halobacillus litoralis]WLR47162.1 DUF3221 domain-containing protein [Halobacillus litoralis]